eukprot:1152981-Pelagomonas_calceolata.AAC.3
MGMHDCMPRRPGQSSWVLGESYTLTQGMRLACLCKCAYQDWDSCLCNMLNTHAYLTKERFHLQGTVQNVAWPSPTMMLQQPKPQNQINKRYSSGVQENFQNINCVSI